jgi:hypothetical protein
MPIKILDGAPHPWGDYGDILVQGMADHLGRAADGGLELERTGPLVPPITFPGISVVVVTSDFRSRLEQSGLGGFTFRPVHKTRIVHLDWHQWDQNAPEPPVFPDSGEPEDYVLQSLHDPAVAEAIGPLWEVVLRSGVTVQRERTLPSDHDTSLYVLAATWTGADLFLADGVGYIYAADRAQEWLLSAVPQWVRFRNCRLR